VVAEWVTGEKYLSAVLRIRKFFFRIRLWH
jgi:hypothetical protein